MNSLRFKIGFVLSVMQDQILNFTKNARYQFRFTVFSILSFGIFSIGVLFKKLPENAIDTIITNMFTIPGAIILLYILFISLFGLYMGVTAKNITKTL